MNTELERLHELDWSDSMTDEILLNLKASLADPLVKGVQFPLFPDPALQSLVNGCSGETALMEAFPFYKRILGYAKILGINVNHDTKVLDFGCGWGRHMRFFWQIVGAQNLYGVDIDPTFVELCKKLFPSGNFINNHREPPLSFDDNTFDIVWSYSVFTHINEEYNLKWMKEIHRVLRPGGMFILTTQGRDFIKFCYSFAGRQHFEHEWFKLLAQIFKTPEEVEAANKNFERGLFQYFRIGGGGGPRDDSFYGEAVVPRKFFVDNWSQYFRIVDFYDPRSQNQQAVIVAQKL